MGYLRRASAESARRSDSRTAMKAISAPGKEITGGTLGEEFNGGQEKVKREGGEEEGDG